MKFDADFLTKKKKEIPFKIKENHVQYKEIDTTNRVVKLIANTLNFFDHDFDSLAPGCANRSIADNGAKSSSPAKIAHLLHHDMHRPVGKSQHEAEETIDGKKVLYCESFLPETIDGDDTLTKYEVEMYNQHSIGFKYLDIKYLQKGATGWDAFIKSLINPEDAEEVGYAWSVKEIMWWEYSTVTFGSNKLTQYLGTKSENKFDIAGIISQKIAILANKAMRREIKDRKLFDFELSQLQQMIYELSAEGTPKKDAQDGSSDDGNQKAIKLLGFSSNLKF